jgi:DivIVA domain-containing protein
MSLTPVDVRNVAFSKAPLGKPSYHKDEVDDLLDLVEATLVRLIEENNDLLNRVDQLKQQSRPVPADIGCDLRPLEILRPARTSMRSPMKQTRLSAHHNAQVSKVLGVAQAVADQLADAANAEACRMLSHVQARCEHLLSEARVKARNMVDEARTQAETMLRDARTKAETLERQSRERAASLEQDATRKHTEILDALSREKRRLENNIDELRSFEQECRTQITTYAHSQLQELDSASDTPVNPARTQQALQGLLVLQIERAMKPDQSVSSPEARGRTCAAEMNQ